MRRYPVASLVAILSLAAGIGATTVTLTVRDIIFHRPPPTYQQPERLSRIQVGSPENPLRPVGNPVPVALYQSWRETIGPSMAAWMSLGEREVRAADRLESISVRAVTPELFQILGVSPTLGLSFSSLGSQRDDARQAILSYRAWDRLFDKRVDVIGQVFWIDDQPHTVVGVMPERFWFADWDSPVWTVLDPRTLPADAVLGGRRRDGRQASALRCSRPVFRAVSPTTRSGCLRGNGSWPLRASGFEGTPLGQAMSFVLPYVLGTAVLLTSSSPARMSRS